jgi:RNA polymerase-binding transcription factor DksA
MTANEIRGMSIHHFPKAIFLQEIAAQLAELNEGIRQLVPARTDAPEPYDPSAQDRHEDELTAEEDRKSREIQDALHAEAVDRPTSDPQKFARCSWCTKEIPIPRVGQTPICDECIPF